MSINEDNEDIKAGWMRYYSEINKLKEEVANKGLHFVHLGKGDFDHYHYQIPQIAKDIMKLSIESNYLPYSHPGGKQDTRELLAQVENISLIGGDPYEYKNITLTIGAAHAFYSILKSVIV